MPKLVLFFLFLCVSAFFSASETAFALQDKTWLRIKAQQGVRRAKLLNSLWNKSEFFFTPILVGSDFVNIAASVLLTSFFVDIYGQAGALISTILGTILIFFFAELLPKDLAARFPSKLLNLLFYPLSLLILLLTPLSFLFHGCLRLLALAFPALKGQAVPFSPQEIDSLARSYGKGSVAEFLNRALSFKKKTVEDAMVPRVDIVAYPEETLVLDILKDNSHKMFSRYPIYRKNIDQVTGILYIKDLLGKDLHPDDKAVTFLRTPYFLVENLPLSRTLEEMRRARVTIALVVDEYGGLSGLITIEDIIEEIAGEIWDEYDLIPALPHEEQGGVILDARTPLSQINEKFQVDLISDSLTIGGYLEELAGRIPERGEKFNIQGLKILILRSSPNRVKQILIYPKVYNKEGVN